MAPQDELYELNIGNVMGGNFPERFAKAFQQVLENIRDVNTPADAPRTITFKFKIKPSDDRQVAAMTLCTDLKLAALEPIAGTMHISKSDGSLKAYIRDIRQEVMFDQASGKRQ